MLKIENGQINFILEEQIDTLHDLYKDCFMILCWCPHGQIVKGDYDTLDSTEAMGLINISYELKGYIQATFICSDSKYCVIITKDGACISQDEARREIIRSKLRSPSFLHSNRFNSDIVRFYFNKAPNGIFLIYVNDLLFAIKK